jgi:hypothetical protein
VKNPLSKSVAIIVLNYNTAGLLQQLLPSVIASTYENKRVIVADNGSTDSSKAVVANLDGVEWLPLDNNYGYAEGYNRAIEQVNSDYVILLNSDVEVSPGWIEPLVNYAKTNGYDALQPKILDFNQRNSFEYAGASGGFMDRLGYPFCRGRIFDNCEKDTGQYDEPIDVFWASGAALFIERESFIEAGGLDKRLFAHMEEIDLCWRLQLMGKKIACVPESIVYHIGGGTLSAQNPKKTYLNFRNSLVLLARYNTGITAFTKVLLRMVLDAPAALLFASRGNIKDVWAIVKAHWNFIFKLSYWLKKDQDVDLNQDIKVQYKGLVFWQYFMKGNKQYSKMN